MQVPGSTPPLPALRGSAKLAAGWGRKAGPETHLCCRFSSSTLTGCFFFPPSAASVANLNQSPGHWKSPAMGNWDTERKASYGKARAAAQRISLSSIRFPFN